MNYLRPEYFVGDSNMTLAIQQQIGDRPFILNISGNLQRKQLDILIETYARLRYHHPDLLLVRVGPEWEPDIQSRIERLGIQHGIRLFSKLEQKDLIELYRRAAIVLMTSDTEGFDFSVMEPLSCRSITVTSDISVQPEVEGNAAVYCKIGKPNIWDNTITHLLNHLEVSLALSLRLKKVKWSYPAETIAQAYQNRILTHSSTQKPLEVFAS